MKHLFKYQLFIIGLLFLAGFSKNEKSGPPHANKDNVVILEDFNISLDELRSLEKWGRNPFLPYFSMNSKLSNEKYNMHQLKLKKLFWKDDLRCALINNKVVRQGDSYLDMKVRYIGDNLVVLMSKNVPCLILKVER